MQMPQMPQPPPPETTTGGRWADLPEVDVEKMDYDYVTKCESAAELRESNAQLNEVKPGQAGKCSAPEEPSSWY